MAKKRPKRSRSAPTTAALGCCKVDSVITVDDRGQMVLPKDIRQMANIHAGDKFAVLTCENDGRVCCISLIKVDDLTGMVKQLLGPVMKDIL